MVAILATALGLLGCQTCFTICWNFSTRICLSAFLHEDICVSLLWQMWAWPMKTITQWREKVLIGKKVEIFGGRLVFTTLLVYIISSNVLLLLIMCMLYSLPFIVAFVISLEGRENGMSLVYFNGMPALNIKRFCVQIYTMLLNRLRLLWHILYQLIVIGNYFLGSIMICNVVLGCCS